MTMEQIGLKMGNWGRELGGWIGNWAISLGEWMNNWAIGLAEIISNMNLLQSIQMLGLLMMFAGVFVIWFLPRYTRG